MALSVVPDKNYLETAELDYFLKSDAENRVVLHDFSAIESLAGNPIKNLGKSMGIVSRYPGQVLVLHNASKLMMLGEIKPEYRFDMVEWGQTKAFEQYCADIKKAEAGDLKYVEILGEHAKAAKEHLDKMLATVPLMAELIDSLAKVTSVEAIKARRDKTGTAMPLRDGIAILQSIYAIASAIAGRRTIAPTLPREPARAARHYVFRFAIALRLYALWWAEQGTALKDVKPTRLRNDFVDLMYVTCATYWDALFTNEEKMALIYSETCYLAEDIFGKMEH
jgi:hypothetical protein